MTATPDREAQTVLMAVLSDPLCEAVLDRLPSLGLREWWLTAGAVFQNVWNAVEGRPPGYGIKDYDVFYFDDTDLSWEAEDTVIRLYAPFGLADVIGMRMRPHRRLAPQHVYDAKVRQYTERWTTLTSDPW